MFKFSSFGSAWITDNFVSAGLIRTAPSMRHNCVQEKITTHLSSFKKYKDMFLFLLACVQIIVQITFEHV